MGGGGIVKVILYRVAYTRGVLREEGYCYGYNVWCRGYQGFSKGGGFF